MKIFLLILLIGIALVTPVLLPVVAQPTQGPPVVMPDIDAVEGFLDNIVKWMWAIASFVIAIFFLYAGFLFVTAGGNDDQINKAKGIVKWALIGVVVMLLATSILGIMQSFVKP